MNIEELVSQINQRFDALGEQVSEAKIREIVLTQLSGLDDNDPIVRKMRFGGESDPALIGTKYARYGLNTSDVEWLYDLLNAGKRAGLSSGPSEELENTFKAVSDAIYVSDEEIKRIDRRALDDLYPRIPKSSLRGLDREQWVERQMRAMDSAETGYGLQLIGAGYVREIWDAARQQSVIASQIEQIEMTDPTMYIPVEVDIPEMLYVGENTANNSSEYTTVKTGSNRVQLDAKKFIIHQMWSGELEEDSIIPFVPYLRKQADASVAYHMDSLAINGDTTNAATGNINLDDADPADTKHYLAFDGIRHAALVDNTGNAVDAAGTITLAALGGLRGTMIDSTRYVNWGTPMDPADLIFAADPQTANAIGLLDPILTWRQMQANAGGGLLAGETSRVLGYPVLATTVVPLTEADGKVSTTAGNNVKGQVVAFNRRGFRFGWRRRVKVEIERLPARDQTRMVYSLRLGFGRFSPTGAASGIESAAVLYDISL